jgi:hypothetical protein
MSGSLLVEHVLLTAAGAVEVAQRRDVAGRLG